MNFALMAFYARIASLLLCLTVGQVFCAIPDQMPAPTVGNILATSVTVSFDTLGDITTYIITLEPRHRTTGPIHRTISNVTSSFETQQQGLTDCTIYYISVRAVNSGGEEGPSGNTTEIRTVPRLSTFHLGSPFTSYLDVLFGLRFPVVEKWLIQYQKASNSSDSLVNSTVDSRFTGRLADLSADTSYELRVRPLRENGTDLPESEDLYSDWMRFKTDSLSIFGSVILVEINYTDDHGTENTMAWNYTRELIEDAYSHITNYGVTIIRNENDGSGKVRTHYRLKVPDKTLPSSTNFTISGGNFTDNFINNGAQADGLPYLVENGNQYQLIYVSATSCDKIVERFMIVTPDDEDTFEIHLNVASSSSTTPEEDDSLFVNPDGSLVRDDDITVRNISLNTALTLTPHFLVKDCLLGGDLNPLYSEFFEATLTSSMEVETVRFTNTDFLVNASAVNYTVSPSATSSTIRFPAVKNAVLYFLFTSSSGSTHSVTLEEEDIDCSDFLTMEVSQLEANTSYDFTVIVTTLKVDSSEVNTTYISDIVIRTLPATTTATITTEAQTTTAAAPTTFSSSTTAPSSAEMNTTTATEAQATTTVELTTFSSSTTSRTSVIPTIVDIMTTVSAIPTTESTVSTAQPAPPQIETTTTNPVTPILPASTEADTDVSTAVAGSSSLTVTTDNVSNLVNTSKETTPSSAETNTTTAIEVQATTTGAPKTFSSSTTSRTSVIPTIVDVMTTVSAVPTTKSTVSTSPPAPPQIERTNTSSITSILPASTEADADLSTAVSTLSSLAVTTDNISNLVTTGKETTSSSVQTTTTATTETSATTTGAPMNFSPRTTRRSVRLWVYIVCGIVAVAACTGIICIVCIYCTRRSRKRKRRKKVGTSA